MKNYGELEHLIGDFKDKLSILPSVPQPILSQIIEDLKNLPPHKHDGKNTISVRDLWEECFLNPHLSVDNIKALFPLVWAHNLSVVRYLGAKDRNLVVNNLINNPHTSDELLNELLRNFYKSLSISAGNKHNQIIDVLINEISKNQKFTKTNQMIQHQKQNFLINLSSENLIRCKSSYIRNTFTSEHYLPKITLNELNLEIKKRKQLTPKSFKKYNTSDFNNFIKTIQSQIQTIKKNHKIFFKLLKNRLLSKNDLAVEVSNQLEKLSKIKENIQQQEEHLKLLLKDLSTPDKSPKPDSSATSD